MSAWMKWAIAILIGFGIIVLGFRFWGWVLSAFFVLNCVVLIIVVLLQSGKAADLAAAFGGAGSQTAFGPRGAATLLSRATTWSAVIFMVTSLTLAILASRSSGGGTSVLSNEKAAPTQKAPAQTPPQPEPQPLNPK